MINCKCADDGASDNDLIACLQSGRGGCVHRSLNGLLDRYKPMLGGAVRRARRVVGSEESLHSGDLQAAEHGARLGLYDAALKYDPTKGVPFAGMARTYVYGAARRELLMQLGWTTEGVRPPCISVDEVPASAVSMSLAVDEAMERRSFGGLTSAVLALGESARMLIVELFVLDMTVTDIAAVRGVRQQSISAQRGRVLNQLRQTVERDLAA